MRRGIGAGPIGSAAIGGDAAVQAAAPRDAEVLEAGGGAEASLAAADAASFTAQADAIVHAADGLHGSWAMR